MKNAEELILERAEKLGEELGQAALKKKKDMAELVKAFSTFMSVLDKHS